MRENTDQKNSKYTQLSRSVTLYVTPLKTKYCHINSKLELFKVLKTLQI